MTDFNRHREKLTKAAHPCVIVDRLATLADALKLVDKIAAEVWGALPEAFEPQVDAILTSEGSRYGFDFGQAGRDLQRYADAWQDQLDREASLSAALTQ